MREWKTKDGRRREVMGREGEDKKRVKKEREREKGDVKGGEGKR